MEKERYELNRKDIGEVRQLLRISHQMGDQIQVMHDWLIQKEVEERIPKDIYETCGECCCNTACGCSLAAGCGACFSLGFSALLNTLINLRICQQTDLTCIHDVTVLKYGFPLVLGGSMLFSCGANLYADMRKSERMRLKNQLLKKKVE